MKDLANRFLRDETGLETIEYAIIAGLVVTAVVASTFAIGTWLGGKIEGLKTELTGS